MKKSHIVALAITVVTLTAALWFFEHRKMAMPVSTSSEKGRVLYWYDPMKPDVHFNTPGRSPFMDMQLLPKYASEASNGRQEILVDPRMVQNLGIRTATVEYGGIARLVRTTGIIAANEKAIEVVQTRAAGWVERLNVRAAGEAVTRGEALAEIYSPDLLAAQHELLVLARAATESDSNALLQAARGRLSLLGLTDAQVSQIQKTGRAQRQVAVYSPVNGVITELGVRQGAQVTPGMSLFTVADLSKVWLSAQVTEAQASWITRGQSAEVRVLALAGQVFTGTVDYVYPELTRDTRTLKARIVLDNPHLALKPGMYADVILQGGAQQEALLMPSESLIRTGTRSTVIVADGGGKFHPVEVVAGDQADGKVAILKGLQEGDDVVTSGQFLIDSEANLMGAFSQMSAPQGARGSETRP